MPGWNGAGVFSRAYNWVSDAAAGIDITAARMDGDSDTFAGGINLCLTKDGQNSPTANLPMAAFKHTNVANGAARTDYAAVGQVQDGSFIWGGTAGGTVNALTLAPSPAITAYAAGQTLRFITSGANTLTNPTLNVSLVGDKTITRQGATALVAGDMPSGAVVEVVYDGTEFQLVNVKKIALADLVGTVVTSIADATNGGVTIGGTGAIPTIALNVNDLTSKASPTTSDSVAIIDAAAANATKKATLSSILALLCKQTLTFGASGFGSGTFFLGCLGNATEANVQVPLSIAGTIKNLYIHVNPAPGGVETIAVTARKTGSAQTLTATVTGAAVSNNDTTHSFTVAAGDLLSFSVVGSGGVGTTFVKVSIEIDPS